MSLHLKLSAEKTEVDILPRKPKVLLLPHSAGSLDDQVATVVLEETMAVYVDGAGFLELWY